MSSDEIKRIKETILGWLKEEARSPEEKTDPNAYFNILVRMGNMGCNIVQNVHKQDSLFVGANLVLTQEQMTLLKGIDIEKRREFFWNLRMNLLMNNELGEFDIKPNPPEDVQAVFVSSKPIYYNDLTKGKLMSSIDTVMKATIMVIWMLEQHAGIITPKKDQKTQYLT